MRRLGAFLILLILFNYSEAQKIKVDKKLQGTILGLIKGYNGDIGIYIKDLKKNKVVAINADSIFPMASMVKIPILVGVMDKINKGELQYDQPLTYKDSLFYAGVDILGSFKNGEKIELGKVIMLMLTMSDNTASLWLQSLAGGGSRINEIMDSLGLPNTKVNSRTAGRENIRTKYGWGQTTPYEMTLLFEKTYTKQIISDSISSRMLRYMSRNFWDDVSLSQIPSHIFVASKNGAVDASRSETLLVLAPGNPYVFSICTKNNKDESWGSNNEAWVLSRKISKLLWDEFRK